MNCGTFRDKLLYLLASTADAIITDPTKTSTSHRVIITGMHDGIIKNAYLLRCHSTLASAGMLPCITAALFHRLRYHPLPPLRPVQPSTLPLYTHTPSITVARKRSTAADRDIG